MPDVDFTLADEGWSEDLGETLSVEEAAKLIAERLGIRNVYYKLQEQNALAPWGPDENAGGYDEYQLAQHLAQTLPEEMRTETVLNMMDLRTLLNEVRLEDELVSTRVTENVNGIEFSPGEQRAAREAFYKFTDSAQKKLADDLEASGAFPTRGDAEAAALELINKSVVQRGTITPIVVAPEDTTSLNAQGQVVATPASGVQPRSTFQDLVDQYSAEQDPTTQRPGYQTASDVELLFRDYTPGAAITNYMTNIGQEAATSAALGLTPREDPTRMRLEPGPVAVGPYMRPGANQAEFRKSQGIYTLSEMASLPKTLKRDELIKLTDRMVKAGLFTQIEGGEPTVMGDFNDPQFKKAWEQLLSTSYRGGKPVYQLIDEATESYQAQLEAEKEAAGKRAVLTDPARLRVRGDELGQELIGRNLTREERNQLTAFIHGLERKEAGAKAELAADEEASGEVIATDWEAQMEEWIERTNPDEAAAKSGVGVYNTLTSLLGPGGSTTRIPGRAP